MMEPIRSMKRRLENDKCDSDTAYFHSLMFLGEMIFKIITLGLLAAIKDDTERTRYSMEYDLVRSSGIGDWANIIEKIPKVTPTFCSEAFEDIRQITVKNDLNSWQYIAVDSIQKCVNVACDINENVNGKQSLMKWFSLFARLRNSTRGHGATTLAKISLINPSLEDSIDQIIDNNLTLNRQWVSLKRCYSRKYYVVRISDKAEDFNYLKTIQAIQYDFEDGIYIYFDKPYLVPLIRKYDDLVTDFYLPNGAWNDNSYELLSYVSDSKFIEMSDKYRLPASELPVSETQSRGQLDCIGNVFTNIPEMREDYVKRSELESELINTLLLQDARPIVSLIGRGGIGKTWLTLKVLHEFVNYDRFANIIWFSSRDVDLTETGGKLVQPHLLSIEEIASEYTRLVKSESDVQSLSKSDKLKYLANDLFKSTIGSTLFVFDNFETLEDPFHTYDWLEQNLRSPNKVLITSRLRRFKADYPFVVEGMSHSECSELIINTTKRIGLQNIDLTEFEDLIETSEGHPYIIKLLIAEYTKSKGKDKKPEKILAARDDVLVTLFERTYKSLSDEAKRIFLTLCKWNSVIPHFALSAVVGTNIDKAFDLIEIIEELRWASFIETTDSKVDETIFISVPLAARIYGCKKLSTSDHLYNVNKDILYLHLFGVINNYGQNTLFLSSLSKFLTRAAEQIEIKKGKDTRTEEIIEFISSEYPEGKLMISDYYFEISEKLNESSDLSIGMLKSYIESSTLVESRVQAWHKILEIYKSKRNIKGQIKTMHAISQDQSLPISLLSECANELNYLHRTIMQLHEDLLDEWTISADNLISILTSRETELAAADFSRIAWLAINLGEIEKGLDFADLGIGIDPNNDYCQRIKERF